jgi:cytochrome c556
MPHRPVSLLLILLSFILSGCGEPEDTGPGRPVAHRREAFLSIIRAFEPMGVSLRTGKYAPDRFIAMAAQLDRVKEGPWEYFTPESNYPPTHSTAAVWRDREGFETGRLAFLSATRGIVAAAATRDEERVKAAYGVLQDTCRDCHKVYKK